ncbi:hypothetical protein PoB_000037700 [Plakobranchus ocellatus]|uniref:Uncharacterized protein n=1 Tax=Plakobranchus ocellatus TaxID=259542 RepID=A0AAV3XUR3_9GAST|nr:hypothetical protein PoB_000037700 [Plakobranchus ocellatus]
MDRIKLNILGLAEVRWTGAGSIKLVSPQQGDLRFSGPPSGQGAGGRARTRDRGFLADIRTGSLATVPSRHQQIETKNV